MVIQVLCWDKHNYVAVFILLIGIFNVVLVNSSQKNCELFVLVMVSVLVVACAVDREFEPWSG